MIRFLPVILFISILFLLSCKTEPKSDEYKGFPWEERSFFETWSHYLGDPHRSHFSVLDQINTANADQLKVAWIYKSQGLAEGKNSQIQNNPMIIGRTFLGVNAANVLFALNAATGEKLWEFSPADSDETGLGLCRGFAYWASASEEPSRVFFSAGFYLYAVDINNGTVITSFGETEP